MIVDRLPPSKFTEVKPGEKGSIFPSFSKKAPEGKVLKTENAKTFWSFFSKDFIKESFSKAEGLTSAVANTGKKLGFAVGGTILAGLGAVGAYFFKDNSSAANIGSIGVGIAGLIGLIYGVGGLSKTNTIEKEIPKPAEYLVDEKSEKYKKAEEALLKSDKAFSSPFETESDSSIFTFKKDDAVKESVKKYLDAHVTEELAHHAITAQSDVLFTNISSKGNIKLSQIQDNIAACLAYVVASGDDTAKTIIEKITNPKIGKTNEQFRHLLPFDFRDSLYLAEWYEAEHKDNDSITQLIGDETEMIKKIDELTKNPGNQELKNKVATYLTKLQNTENNLKILHEVFRFALEEDAEGDREKVRLKHILKQALVTGLKITGNSNDEITKKLKTIFEDKNQFCIKARLKKISDFLESEKFKTAISKEENNQVFPFTRVSRAKPAENLILGKMTSDFYQFVEKSSQPA